MVYKLNDAFYKTKKVETSAELYYICELAKYLHSMNNLGHVLSLDGVTIDLNLRNSMFFDYFRKMCSDGLIVDVAISNKILEVKPYDFFDFNKIFTQTLSTNPTSQCAPKYTQQTNDVWLWTAKGNAVEDEVRNNSLFYGVKMPQGLVSMIAMVAVRRCLTGNAPSTFIMRLNETYLSFNLSISLIDILMKRTNALASWFQLKIDNSKSENIRKQIAQCTYEAWIWNLRDLGECSTDGYDLDVKYDKLKKDFQVGDVVFVYERDKTVDQTTKLMKKIKDCSLGVITEIRGKKQDGTVRVKKINKVNTKAFDEYQYENLSYKAKQVCGSLETFSKCNETVEGYDLYNCGIENYVNDTDTYFIKNLLNLKDSLDLVVKEDGEYKSRSFGVVESAYWLLKENNVEFNEERYKNLYYKNRATGECRTPAYDQFQAGVSFVDLMTVD